MKDIVGGLELYAVKAKYGIYLKCDNCGDTLDAKRVNIGTFEERIGSNEQELKQRALQLGWTGNLDRSNIGNDYCPECSKNCT